MALRSPLTCRQQVNLAEGPPPLPSGVPITTTYDMTFAPSKSVADLQIESVCEAFAFQCGVSTAAVTFEYEPLDGHEGTREDLPREDATDVLCRFQCLC